MSSFSKTLDNTPKTLKTLDSTPKTLESETSKTLPKTLESETSKTLPKTLERKTVPTTYCQEFSVDDLLKMINNPDALKRYGLQIQSVEISAEDLVEELQITEDEYTDLLNDPVECIDGETTEIN